MNDFGQLFHATVFLVGIAYAITLDRHFRVDLLRSHLTPRVRAWVELLGYLLFVLPLIALLAYYGADPVWRSLAIRETFPDTGTPGYFLMRLSFVLFVVLLSAASLARLLRASHAAATGSELQ